MATGQRTPQIVYRRGKHTKSTFTPRPGIDTVTKPGQAPGLSVFDTIQLRPGDMAHGVDVTLLQPPLQAIPDDPADGGTSGHLSIVPVDADGNVDQKLLDEWAATRGQAIPHPLTINVMGAIVQQIVSAKP